MISALSGWLFESDKHLIYAIYDILSHLFAFILMTRCFDSTRTITKTNVYLKDNSHWSIIHPQKPTLFSPGSI